MKTKLALVSMLIAVAPILAAWAAEHFVKQQSATSREALRKGAEFLQPDTHSNLRFGHQKPAHPTP